MADVWQIVADSGSIIERDEAIKRLRMKYGRLEEREERFAEMPNLPLEDALTFFYESKTYELISQGISDMHCLSDYYLADELMIEYGKE